MNCIDVPVPEATFEALSSLTKLTFIYPYSHPMAQAVNITSRLNIVGFLEEDFFEMLKEKKDPKDYEAFGFVPFDVAYVRETAVRNISNKEWYYSHGPKNSKEFCGNWKLKGCDFVKVIALKAPSFSLRELNIDYFNKNARKDR